MRSRPEPLSVALVGCGKRKSDIQANQPAKELYTGTLFRLSIRHALATASEVHILSALHGLIFPDDRIAPYDLCMTQVPISKQSEWGRNVVAGLKEIYLLTPIHLVFYAGQQYIRPILAHLEAEQGYWTWENPLEGLDLFERVTWFKEREARQTFPES